MPWIRQLDSGLWAATIYTPTGQRITESHESKTIIAAWARNLETQKDLGTFIDPRLGKTKLKEVWDLYGDGRRLEKASRKRDASHWNTWVGPQWGEVEIGSIRKPAVTGWVTGLERRGHDLLYPGEPVGGWTIIAALGLLRSLLEIAVDASLIPFNPARGVKAPPPPKHADRNLTDDECDALLENLYLRFPGVPSAGLMCEVMAYCGPRYEEIAAMRRVPGAIDMRHGIIHLCPVMEKDGTIRPYPKSEAGERDVPVDEDLWPRFEAHVKTVPIGGLLFPAPGGGPLLYDNWLKRVWNKGLLQERPMTDAEVEAWKQARREEGLRPWKVNWIVETSVLDDPQPTPHDLRHLYGTRLAEANVPQHERMALMGQEDERAGRRYTNPRDERFDRARDAMKRFRTQRTVPRQPGRADREHDDEIGASS